MPTKELIQVVSYIRPSLKRLAEARLKQSESRMTMSSYIEMLIKRDLQKGRVA